MTRDEGLAELAKRAADSNLYFAIYQGNPYIETIGTDVELDELAKVFGGSFEAFWKSNKYTGKGCLRIRNDNAIAIAKELMERVDFRRSGKYHYASEMVHAHH